MLETIHVAAANFAAIAPNIQQALGLLLLSAVILGVGIGIAVTGLWLRLFTR